jgi:hypothetical protein
MPCNMWTLQNTRIRSIDWPPLQFLNPRVHLPRLYFCEEARCLHFGGRWTGVAL